MPSPAHLLTILALGLSISASPTEKRGDSLNLLNLCSGTGLSGTCTPFDPAPGPCVPIPSLHVESAIAAPYGPSMTCSLFK